MRLYAPITKIDEEQRMVWGYASTADRDEQGEIVTRAALAAALPEYLKLGNIREMHQLSAVGKAKEATFDETGLFLGAKIVDPLAWTKITEGVYNGFSIGGKVTSRDKQDHTIIDGISLTEISVVDRPANPKALFEVWKASLNQIEGSDMKPGLATIGDTPAGEKLAAFNPVQIWACGRADHRHIAKAEALKCFEDDARAKAAGATVEEPAAKAAAEGAGEGDAPEASEAAADTEKAAMAGPDEAETSSAVPGEAATEAEAAVSTDGVPDVEKRGKEAADAAQAVIDAATAAMERGEAVLAEPEATEKAADAGGDERNELNEETPETAAESDDGVAEDVTKAKDSSKPYGDVEYADNGLQADGKKRYPIDTEEHIRAAWNYINKSKNCGKYGDNCAKVKARIVAAWKNKIDKDGPPSAKKAWSAADLLKALSDLGDIASVIAYLDKLAERLAYERAVEGDDSTAPEQAEAACGTACALLRTVANEETAEIMSGTEADMEDADDQMVIAMTSVAEALRKAGLNDLAEPFEKVGTKHSARNQMLLNAAYTCCAKAAGMGGCTKAQKVAFDGAKECIGAAGGKGVDGMAAKSSEALGFTMAIDQLAKGGAHQALADMAHDAVSRVTNAAACTMGKARHSKETMEHLTKAHGFLCAAGASCDVAKDGGDDMVDMAAGVGDLGKTEGTRAAELAKALEVAQAEKATLAKTLSDIVPLLDRLSKRVEDIAQTPLPPMLARGGLTSVSKTDDGRGDDARELTTEEIAAAIAKMSPNEVELIPFKAARFRPLQLNGLRSSSEIREVITR